MSMQAIAVSAGSSQRSNTSVEGTRVFVRFSIQQYSSVFIARPPCGYDQKLQRCIAVAHSARSLVLWGDRNCGLANHFGRERELVQVGAQGVAHGVCDGSRSPDGAALADTLEAPDVGRGRRLEVFDPQ